MADHKLDMKYIEYLDNYPIKYRETGSVYFYGSYYNYSRSAEVGRVSYPLHLGVL